MKNYILSLGIEKWFPRYKYLLIMKLIVILLLVAVSQIQASALAQAVSITKKNAPIVDVFREIKKQTNYTVICNSAIIRETPSIDVNLKNVSLDKALEAILSPSGLTYQIKKKSIVVLRKKSQTLVLSQKESLQDSLLSIRGQVYNTQEPPQALANVTVSVKGTSRLTVTDEFGAFDVQARRGEILVFSMVGFEDEEVLISRSMRNLAVSLKDKYDVLNEVVVTGMSQQQKQHIASSLSVVPVESNIAGKPITTLSQGLQGGVTGISVSQGSGLPGGDAATIKIRGITTLNNSNPLVLVDGVPMDMNHIDPVTVESVTVLKDAAAASIYGSRAANGVIVVTTKRGVPGRLQVGYDGYFGYQTPTSLPRTVDGATYMEMYNEALENSGKAFRYSDFEIEETRGGQDPLGYPDINWVDFMIDKTSPMNSHSLSLSGGNSLARFAVTGNYLDQLGMIPNTNTKRYNIRANTTVTLTDNFLVNLDFLTIKRNRDMIHRVNSSGTLRFMEDLYRVEPMTLPRYPDKNGQRFYGQFADIVNPMAYAEVGGVRKNEYSESMINFRPKWTALPGLNVNGHFTFRMNSDASRVIRENFNHFNYYTGVLLRTWGLVRDADQARSTYYFLGANADYTYNWDKHSIFAIAGYSHEQRNSGNWTIYALQSIFAKLNYTFDNRFLLEGTMRTDGSSRFGPGKRYGYFPSVAVGWNLHNETFLQDSRFVHNLKLRASYGSLGNENIDPYLYQSLLNPTTGLETTHGNPEISWEKVNMLNVGTDIGLFSDNSLEMTIDFYDKRTDGIILEPQLPLTGGFQAKVPVNAGKVRNRGWEMSVNYARQFMNGIRMSVRPGFSYNKNEIIDLPGGPYFSGDIRNQEGYSIGSIFGYRTAGLLQASDFDDMGNPLVPIRSSESAPGDIKYLDLDFNGQINENDQVIIGDPTPKWNYFANFSFDYKKFDLEFLFQGTGKSDGIIAGMFALPLDESKDGGVPTTFYADNYWTPERTDAIYPRLNTNPGDNRISSDFWFRNAAYTRVKFIQLGYTFNDTFVHKLGITKARIYLNAQNPLTFTKLELIDPESRGDQWKYGIMSTYTVGASIKF